MAKKTTAPPESESGGASKQQETDRRHHSPTTCNLTQPPAPGTALSALLRRYRMDLLSADRTREMSTLVECCDVLLMAADGPEVRP